MKAFEIKKILIPIDFSTPSLKAINPAIELAKLIDADITLVHVINILPSTAPFFYFSIPSSPIYESDLTEMSDLQLSNLAESIKKNGITKVKTITRKGSAHKEIVLISKKIKADVIIMGTHGTSGFSEFFMGSNTFRVVSQAECPVISVQKNITSNRFKNIIVPFRDKPHSREKINYAITLAKIYGARLHVIGVETEGSKSNLKKMTLEGEQIIKIVEGFGVNCKLEIVTESYLADTILKYAEKTGADLIIVTSDMDKVSVSEYFMGPFMQQIVNHSPIPVFSLRSTFNTGTVDLGFY